MTDAERVYVALQVLQQAAVTPFTPANVVNNWGPEFDGFMDVCDWVDETKASMVAAGYVTAPAAMTDADRIALALDLLDAAVANADIHETSKQRTNMYNTMRRLTAEMRQMMCDNGY